MTTPAPLKPPPPIRAIAPRYSVVGTKATEGHPRKKVLYWGEYFTGKTTYAKSFPGPFFIYFDPDSTTVQSHPTDIPCVYVTSKAMMDDVVRDVKNRKLTEVVRSFGPQWAEYKVESVILDSSTFQDRIIEEWLDANDVKGVNRWDQKKRAFQTAYADLCEGSEYKVGAEQYYVVVTAHEKVKRNDKGEVVDVTTCISGDFNKILPQYFDTIIFCEVTLATTQEGKALLNADGSPKTTYLCRTAPPDKFRKCGARGLVKLPPVLQNGAYFEELRKYWGDDTSKEK
jgi:hypothetical protein